MAYLYYTLASLSRQCNMTASRSRYRSRAPGFFNKGPHDFELDQNSEQVRDPWSREVEYETPGTPMDLMGRAGLVNFAPSLHTLSTIIIIHNYHISSSSIELISCHADREGSARSNNKIIAGCFSLRLGWGNHQYIPPVKHFFCTHFRAEHFYNGFDNERSQRRRVTSKLQ